MKYRELIADNLSKAGWSWGCVSAVDRDGRTIWIADAHRDDESNLKRERPGRPSLSVTLIVRAAN
jgi:hypothetical protein